MNKNLIEKIKLGNKELIEKGNLDCIPELFAANYMAHAGGKNYKGHKFIKRWAIQLRSAINAIRVAKIELLMETENTIVWQRTLTGIHTTEMWGIKPSGQKVKWREMAVSHFDDEKIIEEWVNSEFIGELLSKPPIV